MKKLNLAVATIRLCNAMYVYMAAGWDSYAMIDFLDFCYSNAEDGAENYVTVSLKE